jgi:alkylated DNA repair protein alkB family protein 6
MKLLNNHLLSLVKKVKEESRKSDHDDTRFSDDNDGTGLYLEGWDLPSLSADVKAALRVLRVSNNFLTLSDSLKLSFHLSQKSFDYTQLRGRRCLPLGGRVTSSGLIPKNDIPAWLHKIFDRIDDMFLRPGGLPKPNHALINVYEPGEGIMAHEDGPAYTRFATILSLSSGCVFDFVSKDTDRREIARVYLPVGSLLFFTDEAYTDVFHEFKSSRFDVLSPTVLNAENLDPERLGESSIRQSDGVLVRGRRISITMRHVPLVAEDLLQ